MALCERLRAMASVVAAAVVHASGVGSPVDAGMELDTMSWRRADACTRARRVHGALAITNAYSLSYLVVKRYLKEGGLRKEGKFLR